MRPGQHVSVHFGQFIAMFADQAFARRLLFAIRPHVEVATARATLRAYDLISERWHFNVVGVFRHVDQALVFDRHAGAAISSLIPSVSCRGCSFAKPILFDVAMATGSFSAVKV